MDSQKRGFRDRFRDWRHRRSLSEGPSINDPPKVVPPVTTTTPKEPDSINSPPDDEASHQPSSGTNLAQATLPFSNISPPTLVVVPPITDSKPSQPSPSSLEDLSSQLWKDAYTDLRNENKPLVENYETVLKEQANVPQNADMRDQLGAVAKIQREKAINKQWRFQWLDEKQSVRDVIERILNMTNEASSLISIGMQFAPPYVSIPWSAVTALIPFMTNDISEYKGCMDGLEIVAKLIYAYQMAEKTFLGREQTRDFFRASVMGLYKKILQYQILAIDYFGKSTLRRLGKSVLGSTEWTGMPADLSTLDNETRRSLEFLGRKSQIESLMTLEGFMKQQQNSMKALMQKVAADQDQVSQVIDWITPISVQQDHRDVRKTLGQDHFSSGNWYLETPELNNWKVWEQGHQCFWLKGGVGTGKSSLISILIEDLFRCPDGVLAFFYCSQKADKGSEKSTSRTSHENALRSLLSQLCVTVDGKSVHESVLKSFNRDARKFLAGVAFSAEECVQLMDNIFSSNSELRFTIIVDALDECGDYDSLLQSLLDATSSNPNVRLAFSSRLEVKVQDYFTDAAPVFIMAQNKDDIQRYLEIEIPKRRVRSGMTDDQASRLKKVLLERASGMFMWVKLQVNMFLHEIMSKRIRLSTDIEPMLKSLEESEATGEELLYVAYGDVYQTAVGSDYQKRRKEIVITALRWVLCAFRSLTLRELAYATSVKSDGTADRDVQEGLVLEFCSNLLIEDAKGIIRLSHLSVRHYLEHRTPPDFERDETHLQAALSCLYFATSPIYHNFGQSKAEVLQQGNVSLTKSFYSYVADHWIRHCQQARKTPEVDRLMDEFTGNVRLQRTKTFSKKTDLENEPIEYVNRKVKEVVIELDSDDGDEHFIDKIKFEPVFQQVFLDFYEVLSSSDESLDYSVVEADGFQFLAQYIARGGDLDVVNQSGRTLLHETIRFRKAEMTKTLIDAGAPVDAADYHGNSPMHIASMQHFETGMQLLLRAGADKNIRNLKGETPLHLSAMFEAQGVFEILLSANADVLARDHNGNTALHYLVSRDSSILAESVLMMGYDPNGKNQNGETAISLAIRLGRASILELLLKYGVPMTIEDRTSAKSSEFPEIRRVVETSSPQDLVPKTKDLRDDTDQLYRVDFMGSDGSPCEYCNASRWFIGSQKGTSYRHHSSIKHLFASADRGCPCCEVFKRELESQQGEDIIRLPGDLMVTVDPSYAQGSKLDRKDKLILELEGSAILTLEICIEQDDDFLPILDWISGKATSDLPTNLGCLQMVQSWVDTCRSSHALCENEDVPLLPTRILDVGTSSTSKVRIITNKGASKADYVYLSCLWGGGNGRDTLITKQRKLQEFQNSIPFARLTMIQQNAISMTRSLGIRYLWLDMLCIIHDDINNTQTEIPNMEKYLLNSTIQLVASGDGRDAALFNNRPEPILRLSVEPRSHVASKDSMKRLKQAVIQLRRPIETAEEALDRHVLKRGWMVQEMILPRRLLILGANQLYWHCRTCLRSEASSLVQKPFLRLLPREKNQKVSSLLPWYGLVPVISAAFTTFALDKLVILESIARYFDAGSKQTAGIWVEDLRNGIVWRAESSVPMEKNGMVRSDKPYLAPSWSWVSAMKKVRYDMLMGCDHERVPMNAALSVVDIVYDTSYPDVTPGHLDIEGMTMETPSEFDQKKCICFFDNIAVEQRWEQSKSFVLVFICPWTFRLSSDSKQDRCLGIVLQSSNQEDKEVNYDVPFTRVGVFLAASFDQKLEGWTRRRLRLI